MNNIKTFAWGLGITTLASLVTVPAGGNYPDKNHDIGISHPVGIYASYEEDESEAESRDAEKKSICHIVMIYMILISTFLIRI